VFQIHALLNLPEGGSSTHGRSLPFLHFLHTIFNNQKYNQASDMFKFAFQVPSQKKARLENIMKSKAWKIFAIFSIMIFALSISTNLANAITELSIPPAIVVGQNPNYVVYDSGKNELFTPNMGDGTVSVILDSTSKVVATIPVGTYPATAAYDAGKGEVFVANEVGQGQQGTVSVISDSNNTVVATVNVGQSPEGIVYDSSKGEIFVANTNYNPGSTTPCTVSVISDIDNTVVATITVGVAPTGMTYDSGKGEIFVSNQDSGTLSVISDSTNKVVATIPINNSGSEPLGTTYDSAMHEIFVTSGDSAAAYVVSDKSNSVIATISLSGGYYGNVNSGVYDPGRNEVALDGDAAVVLINDQNNSPVAWIPLTQLPVSQEDFGPLANGIAYDSSNGYLYTANSGYSTVSVISNFTGVSASSATSTPLTTSTSTSSSSSNTLLFAIIGVVLVAVVVVIVAFLKFGHRKAASTGVTGNPDRSTGSVAQTTPAVTKDQKNESILEESTEANSKTSNVTTPSSSSQTQQDQAQVAQTAQQSQQRPLGQQGTRADRFRRLVSAFQQKGATSPEKALTVEQLGLSHQFEDFMEKREGQTRVFKEINGKYYLDKEALEQMRKQMANGKTFRQQ